MDKLSSVPDNDEFIFDMKVAFLDQLSLIIVRSVVINFMYLRATFCTFQISVDFYFVPVGGRGGGRGGAGEGEGARERGIECILYGYT